MPRIRFTARTIEAIKPPMAGRVEYWSDSEPGFGLRVSYSGKKRWVAMFRINNRLRRLTIGNYPALSLSDAAKMARDAFHEVEHGKDPSTEKQELRKAETFAELATEYLIRHAMLKKKSWREDQRLLEREFLPSWRNSKAKLITRRDVLHQLDQIVDRGSPVQANRALAVVRKVFNFGIVRDIVEVNPCWKIPAPSPEKQRDRVLSKEEIRALWEVTAEYHVRSVHYLRFLLLTAQRPGEVAGMEWAEIDFSTGWWTIPAKKAKNGLPHRVPLNKPALQLLRELKLSSGSATWVFPSPSKPAAIQNFKKPLNAVRTKCGIEFRPHDLRRTAASHMTSIGVSRLTVSKILNHVESSITAVYDRYGYDAEKRDAMELWGKILMDFLSDEKMTTKEGNS